MWMLEVRPQVLMFVGQGLDQLSQLIVLWLLIFKMDGDYDCSSLTYSRIDWLIVLH